MPTEIFETTHTKKKNLLLRVAKGHFATGHSHINYYIDVAKQKTRLSEADAVATELVSYYQSNTIIDTILCLDGMQVVGTCLARRLTEANYINVNAHQTIYVLTPEYASGGQIVFREGLTSAVQGKHVLILAASVTTGYTAKAAIEAVQYYGGAVVGVSSIFATVHECMGHPVYSAFDTGTLADYASYPAHECPLCKAGERIDALVNSFGFSKL
ncbi:MAG: orotate phosphoribosyltransferase [Clostridia bacterium]|nr:orotate phosphoribosyltransferase [Clostridia bacterium]